jgi:cbb3-type cytochrome oxidase maturation protein
VDSLYLLIPIALVLVAIAIRAFFWAVRSGQYDDLDTESRRILFDEPNEKQTQQGTIQANPLLNDTASSDPDTSAKGPHCD